MIQMHGSSRVLDSSVEETGTSAARRISLYGVTSLSELANKPLLVKSLDVGVANTTIQINSLTATSLKVFKDGNVVNTYAGWIQASQLYFLVYNGVVFVAYPLGLTSSGGSSTPGLFTIPIAVTSLTSSSTAAQILTAFGSADAELNLQEAIEYGASVNSGIVFEDSATSHRLYLLETSYNSSTHEDKIRFISLQLTSNKIFTFTFLRDSVEGSSTPYLSVTVDTYNIISSSELNAAIANYAPKTTTLTIATNAWVLNSSTNNYEYTVTDASITANTSIEISMDLANQALFTDGYTESAAGSYKIITSTVPSASVTMTVKIQNTIAI